MLILFALPALADKQIFIPHLTDGNNHWEDFLTIDNTGLDPAEVVITLYDIDGSQVYQGHHSVGSLGETLIDVRELSGVASSGMIEIPEGGYIHCRVSLESSAGGVAEFMLEGKHSSKLAFLYSEFAGVTVWKGLTVTNYGNVGGEITLMAYGNGKLLGTSEPQEIAPHGKLLGVPDQWFPGIDSHKVKKIIVLSSIDTLGGVAIAGDVSMTRLLFTAAVNLEQFTSPPEKGITGIWKGTWRSNSGGSGEMLMHMTQRDNQIVGSGNYYDTICGDVNNVVISGSVSGDRLTINSSYWCGKYLAIITSSGTRNGDLIKGNYSIEASGANYYDSGVLNLTRSE